MSGLLETIKSPADVKKLEEAQLDALAAEIREKIISRVSEAGGHLASNLGVVELTIALHRVFTSPRDSIVWDVGHQCYPHKLITGRYGDFDTLRTRGGISGFPKRNESEHDSFNTGHGSTSVSAALGMAVGRDINGEPSCVIGVCGDGSMSGGMVFEAINHAGELGRRMILVLNDNEFSISPVTGALGKSLSRIRTSPQYVKVHRAMHARKGKAYGFFSAMSLLSSPLRSLTKYLAFKKGIIFEELGFTYVGPVDGHDIEAIVSVLENVKDLEEPILLHVVTQKGRGYKPAENDPSSFHGVSRLAEGERDHKMDIRPGKTFTAAFSESMMKICEKDQRVVGITAAMASGTGIDALMKKFPGRMFDTGMAEQHSVTFAAGLATRGLRPVVAVYSSFLQRAYDQVFHDVCLQNLPVIFAVDRAGLVSRYGQTHQGLLDISFLRNMPNMMLMAPRDTMDLERMMEFALEQDCPVAIRYPSGADAGAVKAGAREAIVAPSAEILHEGEDVSIWAVGTVAASALKAAKLLLQKGVSAEVVDVRFIKPFDEAALLKSYRSGMRDFVTAEDHLLEGGFGSLFLEKANELGLKGINVTRMGVESVFVADDGRNELLAEYSLTAEGIAGKVMESVSGEAVAQHGVRGADVNG